MPRRQPIQLMYDIVRGTNYLLSLSRCRRRTLSIRDVRHLALLSMFHSVVQLRNHEVADFRPTIFSEMKALCAPPLRAIRLWSEARHCRLDNS